MSRVFYTFVLAAALAACGKKKEEPAAPPAGSATAVVAADAQAGSGAGSDQGSAAGDALDVPTEIDFEDLAATEIDDKNVEARVKAIEQELQQ